MSLPSGVTGLMIVLVLVGLRWHLTVALFRISLITTEHLVVKVLACQGGGVCVCVKCLLMFLAHF